MFDVAALALAEILTGDVEQREDALFRETNVPRGAAVLIDWLTHIRDADEDDREFLDLWEATRSTRRTSPHASDALRVAATLS